MEDAGAKADRDRRLSEGVLLEAKKKNVSDRGVPGGPATVLDYNKMKKAVSIHIIGAV